jgi:hypothetical protein
MAPTAHPQTTVTEHGVPVVDISDVGPGRTPIQQAMELMRRHGPMVVCRLHGREALFVSDLDLVTDLADKSRFAKAVGPALENVREFAADGLFTAYNDEPNWAKAHDILMPAFALGPMRTYHPVMLRVARRLIESWDRAGRAGPAGERSRRHDADDPRHDRARRLRLLRTRGAPPLRRVDGPLLGVEHDPAEPDTRCRPLGGGRGFLRRRRLPGAGRRRRDRRARGGRRAGRRGGPARSHAHREASGRRYDPRRPTYAIR